jgi:hypothetical protein
MLPLRGDYAAHSRTASGTNIVLGIWLVISPWVFDYSGTLAVVSSVLSGFLISILAACRVSEYRLSMGLSGVNLVLAVWTTAAPWAIGYETNIGAVRNNVIVGVAVAVLAIWSAGATVAWNRHSSSTRVR